MNNRLLLIFTPLLFSLQMGVTSDNWWQGFTGWIFQGMKRFYCFLVSGCLALAEAVGGILLGWLPGMPADWWGSLLGWYGMINAWVPVEIFVYCVVSYFTVSVSFAAYKVLIAFWPF